MFPVPYYHIKCRIHSSNGAARRRGLILPIVFVSKIVTKCLILVSSRMCLLWWLYTAVANFASLRDHPS